MSLLPNQILPETVPLGQVNEDGTVTINHGWYLYLYNLMVWALPSGPNNDILAIETFLPRVAVPAPPNPAGEQLRYYSFSPKAISAPISPASDLLRGFSFAPKNQYAPASPASDLLRIFSFLPKMQAGDVGNSQRILENQIFGA